MARETAPALLTPFDLHLFSEGTYYRCYEKFGAHLVKQGKQSGAAFTLWAPNAQAVSVIGDFNNWQWNVNGMDMHRDSGVWECFIPGVKQGACYKFAIESRMNGYRIEKADPYAFASELRPRTASKVWKLSGYEWRDAAWMAHRGSHNTLNAPIAIYEVHLGSWMRTADGSNRWLNYREIAPKLASYVKRMGFTHVELLPIAEHPFDGSWGYQVTGYYAPTSRFGTPQDFMFLVDTLHQSGVGVILDWVPSHFPKDAHGLSFFDGTCLYEHADWRKGEQKEWGTLTFNYSRNEVSNFLINNALFWLKVYHIDGLRMDAVASMLYLDYSRKDGEWIPNAFGGRENIEAIEFLRRLNTQVYQEHPDTLMIAEESTAWAGVSRPVYTGGLGFGFKWDMGWMHDTLAYLQLDPVYRRYHHNQLTFRMLYAFTENFILPLSHDEVVHGKGSLLGKMPGDAWQRLANLRLLFGIMYTQPGKKLLFMGGEFGQLNEWNHDQSLDWHLLDETVHAGLQRWVRDLNFAYQNEKSLHDQDANGAGFEWIDCNDTDQNVVSFLRKSSSENDPVLVVCNFSPVARPQYRLGVPASGAWQEILNSDALPYGGSGQGNCGAVEASSQSWHGRPASVSLILPPLSCVVLKRA